MAKEDGMTSLSVHIVGSAYARLGESEKIAFSEACAQNDVSVCESTSPEAISQVLNTTPQSLLFVDSETLAELVEKHNFIANKQTVLVLFDRENSVLEPHLSKIEHLHYVISAHHPLLLKAACESIFKFVKNAELKGINNSLLRTQSIDEQKITLTSSNDRSKAQDSTLSFFADNIMKHKESLSPGISSYPKYMADVLDELLMNAIWDANHRRLQADRTESVCLDQGENISINASFDGRSFALTVQDSHGSFPKTAIRKPMKYALGFRDETEIQENTKGAGLGLYMVLQKVIAISFEVTPEKTTRVTVLLMGDQSLREMQKRPRTVLFLFTE